VVAVAAEDGTAVAVAAVVTAAEGVVGAAAGVWVAGGVQAASRPTINKNEIKRNSRFIFPPRNIYQAASFFLRGTSLSGDTFVSKRSKGDGSILRRMAGFVQRLSGEL
jgi:hypothetical protein